MRPTTVILVAGVLGVAPQSSLLRLAGVVPLDVEGRIDHLSVDVRGQRLFVAALGNDTIETVDLAALRVTQSVPGMDEPQGIKYLPDQGKVVIANGGTGVVTFLDASSGRRLSATKLTGDADNVRYDAGARRVYVGYGSGALAVIDAGGNIVGDIRVGGHPESFQLEAAGRRIFVNVPSANYVAVVDKDAGRVVATWPVTQARANYPMALDEPHHRLFLGCRSPARLLVFDTESGRAVTGVDIAGDTDDVFFDSVTRRIYVAGGEGAITVVEQQDGDHYRVVGTVPTAPGARTALFVPELRRLYLAVPHRGSQRAEVRVYALVE